MARSSDKIIKGDRLDEVVSLLKKEGRKIVFTNGCFDVLHVGHTRFLEQARQLGDALIVGLNTDRSVSVIKGPERPIIPENERAEVLAALESVSYVTFFSEETPYNLIRRVVPDVLVKGGDWPIEKIVGRDVVEANGGRVLSLPFHPGKSSSDIIQKIESL